jgi:hypothetical protein
VSFRCWPHSKYKSAVEDHGLGKPPLNVEQDTSVLPCNFLKCKYAALLSPPQTFLILNENVVLLEKLNSGLPLRFRFDDTYAKSTWASADILIHLQKRADLESDDLLEECCVIGEPPKDLNLVKILLFGSASRVQRGTCSCLQCRGNGTNSCKECQVRLVTWKHNILLSIFDNFSSSEFWIVESRKCHKKWRRAY